MTPTCTSTAPAPGENPPLESLPLYVDAVSPRYLSAQIPKVTHSNAAKQAEALRFMISWIGTKSKWGWTPSSLYIFHARLSAMVSFMVTVELRNRRAAQKAIFRRHTLGCRQLGWSREEILAGQLKYYQDVIEVLQREFRAQVYEELADTVARTRTVVAAIDGQKARGGRGGIEEGTWERWAELVETVDRLGLPDCDVGSGTATGALATWIVQAENNGRLQASVEAPERSWLVDEDEQAGTSVSPKVTVFVHTSEDVDNDVPMLIVTAPIDD